MPKKIAFHHFGCKVNFSEASALARQFRERGYELTGHREQADIYVINTCAVTREAEKKCIYAIRQTHRLNPEAKIVVMGCFSELNPEEIRNIEGVTLVLGQSDKFRLFDLLENMEPATSPAACDFVPSYSMGDRTRSFLKIQDGCDYYCAYCTIPLARGHSRSDTIANVVKEAREIAAAGVREIVLTGVNIGEFGRHHQETFRDLLIRLEQDVDIPRIRFSSIEPNLLSDEIIRLVASSRKIMPHFHIPLQSGSDKTLRAMHRKYDTALYAGRISTIRSLLPYACIAADVIVGFPGETDADFDDAYRFMEGLDISYLHVFSYSRRDHTRAAAMEDQVPGHIIHLRSEELHRLSETKKHRFYEQNRGRREEALLESTNVDGMMHGFTGNYIKVKRPFDPGLTNQIVPVILDRPDDDMTFII